jgi:NADPH:quinone reductase
MLVAWPPCETDAVSTHGQEVTKAVVATDFGGPEVLELIDVPLGAPGPGEIAVDVRAIGVNPVDWKRYAGFYGRDESLLPMRIGFEAAGVVSAVGSDAVGPAGPIAVGDEVILFRAPGAYAERLVVPAAAAVPKPASVSFELGAGLMLAGATAIHCLAATSAAAGDTVLVHGASGGVGLLLVEIAVGRGMSVIGTASERNHAALEALGAQATVYGDGLLERVRALAPDGVDVAIDCIGTDEALDVSLELVADRSRIATIVAFARGLEDGIKVLGGGPGADPGTELRNAARLELAQLAGDGKLQVPIKTMALADAAEAHREGAHLHTHGKVVLIP